MLTTLIYSLFALDQTLAELAAQHATLMFAALFIVIFAETGLVVFPLLPGDSLLFVAGTVVASSGIDIHVLVLTLFAAAVLGDSVNYGVGHYIGPKAFNRPHETRLGRWLKPEYLDRTHVCTVSRRRRSDELPQIPVLQRDRRGRMGRLAGICRLPVRQYSVDQGQSRLDRSRNRAHLAAADGDAVR